MLGLCFTARSMSAVSLLSLKMLEPPHASSVNSDIHKMNIYIYSFSFRSFVGQMMGVVLSVQNSLSDVQIRLVAKFRSS